jgi:small subunit ribosomal protein S17|tara:strand:- start:404 stop:754 length:351 start_codon:yes stop_codon:yes gene_type:complete
MNKMKEKTIKNLESDCKDRLCPEHGNDKLKLRGRSFDGIVIKKFHGRITIEFERMFKIPKYERYEKRKTKIYARLPDCMANKVSIGDLVQVAETRPISKMIHFVLSRILKTGGAKR